MAAIAAELAPDIATLVEEGPEIEVGQGQAGRETLAAIAHEMFGEGREIRTSIEVGEASREPRHTMSYEDRPLTPLVRPMQRTRTATLDYAERPARTKRSPHVPELDEGRGSHPTSSTSDHKGSPVAPGAEAEFEIHEMITFVVKGDLAQLSSTTARRDFVRDHLMHRLPVSRLSEVDRIDVTPWTVKGTVIVRVWCHVPAAPA